MKLLLTFFLLCVAAQAQNLDQQFPDAPEPVTHAPFGGYVHDKTGDPARQPIFTKKFVVAHAIYLGSTIADIEFTQSCIHRGTCAEGNGIDFNRAGRGEMYRNDLIPFAAITALDILLQHCRMGKAFGWVPYMGPVYGTALHVRGAMKAARY